MKDGAGGWQAAEHRLRRVCPGLLGSAQAAVPGRVDPQGDRGVQQAVLRLVVQPLRTGARPVSGNGRQVRAQLWEEKLLGISSASYILKAVDQLLS